MPAKTVRKPVPLPSKKLPTKNCSVLKTGLQTECSVFPRLIPKQVYRCCIYPTKSEKPTSREQAAFRAVQLVTIVVADGIIELNYSIIPPLWENIIFQENSKCTLIGGFNGTAVRAINFPRALVSIEANAFKDTPLEGALVIPEGC